MSALNNKCKFPAGTAWIQEYYRTKDGRLAGYFCRNIMDAIKDGSGGGHDVNILDPSIPADVIRGTFKDVWEQNGNIIAIPYSITDDAMAKLIEHVNPILNKSRENWTWDDQHAIERVNRVTQHLAEGSDCAEVGPNMQCLIAIRSGRVRAFDGLKQWCLRNPQNSICGCLGLNPPTGCQPLYSLRTDFHASATTDGDTGLNKGPDEYVPAEDYSTYIYIIIAIFVIVILIVFAMRYRQGGPPRRPIY